MADPPRMALTQRDRQLLLRLHYYRFLTTHQFEALLFHTGKTPRSLRTQCQRRLQLLYHHGYVARIPLRVTLDVGTGNKGEGRKPFVYVLDRLGLEEVVLILGKARSQLDPPPRLDRIRDWRKLAHDIANNDTLIVIDRLVQAGTVELSTWLTQRQLKSSAYKQMLPAISVNGSLKLKEPDSYFVLNFANLPQPIHCFYEEDLDTEVESAWQEKVTAYFQYRHQGRAYEHFGCRNFRVLTKTTDQNRLAKLKRAFEYLMSTC
ncbi:MAG: replication-relaxation family protein [Chloroflexota bacterium]